MPCTMHFGTPVVPEEYRIKSGSLKRRVTKLSGGASPTKQSRHMTAARIPATSGSSDSLGTTTTRSMVSMAVAISQARASESQALPL